LRRKKVAKNCKKSFDSHSCHSTLFIFPPIQSEKENVILATKVFFVNPKTEINEKLSERYRLNNV
jgi:hypothetical protein